MRQTRQAVHAIKQSIYVDVYGDNLNVVWAKFSTVSLAVLVTGVTVWYLQAHSRVKNSAKFLYY
jgi:hypothetical protein